MLKGFGSETERQLNALHNTLVVQRRWTGGEACIPDAPPPFSSSFEDKLVVSKDSEEATVWIPVELVFNYANADVSFAKCNMPLFFPLVGLYRGLLANSAPPESWRENFLIYSSGWLARNNLPLTPGRAESVLASRVGVFQEMNRLFEVDMPFFTRNPAKVVMPQRGRFNMTSSGRNRIAFLIAKGYRYVPLAVPLKAYEEWNSSVYTEPLRNLFCADPLLRPFSPIPHPTFAGVSSHFVNYMRLFPLKIAERLVTSYYRQHCFTTKEGLHLFDDAAVVSTIRSSGLNCLLKDSGTAARYFTSLGFLTTDHVDPSWQGEHEMVQSIDNLFAPSVRTVNSVGEILLLDSLASIELALPLLKRARLVYFLLRDTQDIPVFLRKNFRETFTLFDTCYSCGRIMGKEFIRLEQI